MMRKKHLATEKVDENRKAIADYLGLDYSEVIPTDVPESYTINISENLEAQAQYKKSIEFGNTFIPNLYNFDTDLQVRWTGKKLSMA